MFQSQVLQILNVYMYRKRDNIKMYTGVNQMNWVFTLVYSRVKRKHAKISPSILFSLLAWVRSSSRVPAGLRIEDVPTSDPVQTFSPSGPLEDLWSVQNVLFFIIIRLLLRYTSYCFCRAYEENLPHICVTVNFSCRNELVETVITVLSCALP